MFFITLEYLREKLNTANIIHEYKFILDGIPIRWRDCIIQIVDPNWQKNRIILSLYGITKKQQQQQQQQQQKNNSNRHS